MKNLSKNRIFRTTLSLLLAVSMMFSLGNVNVSATSATTTQTTASTTETSSDTTGTNVTINATPEVVPTTTPEVVPTTTPEVAPTATPEVAPTTAPEVVPTATPEVEPTATPEVEPTATPEVAPTATPEVVPTATPEAGAEIASFSLMNDTGALVDTITYEVAFHTLNDKLIRYDNYNASSSYIRNINTVLTTLTPTKILDAEGALTHVSISSAELQSVVLTNQPVGFSNFIGWALHDGNKDFSINNSSLIDTSTDLVFDINDGVLSTDGKTMTFNVYAKFDKVNYSGNTQILFNGNFYDFLAYPASSLESLNMLPAATVSQTVTTTTEKLDVAGLTGEKTAQWEDYDNRIASVNFDFIINPEEKTNNSDVIIVLDKSLGMTDTYLGGANSGSAWDNSANATSKLASELLSDTSLNNRVAVVQFAGNTLNSFNFQSDINSFNSNFVTTKPSGAHMFRNDDGDIVYNHDYVKTANASIDNPSADGSDLTNALLQAQIFADSRTETDRELVVLVISNGRQYTVTEYTNPYSSQIRHWTHTYNDTPYYAVAIAETDSVNLSDVNGHSVLDSGFTPTIHTIGINKGGSTSNAAALGALSAKTTGGTHSTIPWDTSSTIDTIANVAIDIFDGGYEFTAVTDSIIQDVISENFEVLADSTHPVTINHNGVVTELVLNTDDTLDLNEYELNTVTLNGESRQEIKANIGTINGDLTSFKFYVQAVNSNIAAGDYAVSDEHNLTYNKLGTIETKNDFGNPELTVSQVTVISPVSPSNPSEPSTPTTPVATLPVLPVPVPAVPEVEDEEVVIDEPEAPLADADTDVSIQDPEAPLAGIADSWALVNLLLAILTAAISLLLIISHIKRNNENTKENKGVYSVVSVILALAAVVLFVLTQDMNNSMVLVDNWTVITAVISIAQLVVALKARNNSTQNSEIHN